MSMEKKQLSLFKNEEIDRENYVSGGELFKAAYMQLRWVCQIVHNRLYFLKDDIDEARNGKRLVDRHEALFKATEEIENIQHYTGRLQTTYHALMREHKDDVASALCEIESDKNLGLSVKNAEQEIIKNNELYRSGEDVLKKAGIDMPKIPNRRGH